MYRKINQKLRELLIAKDWSVAEFAEMADLPIETVKNIYYGRSEDPKISTVAKMARALGISLNDLMSIDEHNDVEKQIIEHYRACGEHGKGIIALIAKYEALSAKAERDAKSSHKIPCLVANGGLAQGIIYDQTETMEIDTTVEAAYVAIKLVTNEIAPLYCKGDVILIENRFPNDGEIGAFIIGSKVYIRRFIEEKDGYRLKCLHSFATDIVVKRLDQVEYIGTCIGAKRD